MGDHAARAEREWVGSGFVAVKESVRSRGGATGVDEGVARSSNSSAEVRVCFSQRW